jgi:predicted amidohydrolase
MSTIKISLIQANLSWENKVENLRAFEQKINALKGATNIVVLPEMFSTGFSMQPEKLAETMDGETLLWMKNLSASNRLIITGSLIIKEGEDYYNRLIWMLPNGDFGYYDKRHLFGFAGEDQHYSFGEKRLIASVNGWKINLQICYDLRFPVWARQNPMARRGEEPEYDVLIYVANWPERRSHAWKTLLQARAIENQSYVVGVNRVGEDGNGINHSGDSCVIDPFGESLYSKSGEEDVYTIELNKETLQSCREKLSFLKDADGFTIL